MTDSNLHEASNSEASLPDTPSSESGLPSTRFPALHLPDPLSALPPRARRQPAPTTIHNVTLSDDYAWLRDKSSPEVLAHLAAENAYTAALMAPTRELQTELYFEMLSHIQETDESVPYPDHGWLYWTRTIEGRQYPIHCRCSTQPNGQEEILLDVNQLALNQPYMAVGAIAVSPDGTLLAYTTDNTGFRQYTLHIKNLQTGQHLPDTAPRVGSLVWAADSRTLLYTTEDDTTKRHDSLYLHALTTPQPTLLLHEPDERFNLAVGKTRDRKYILIETGSHTTSEVRFLPADNPHATPILIAPRIDDQQYFPDHRDGIFYIRTNDTTKNFRLVTAPVATPGREHWRQVFAGDSDVPLDDFDLFADFCVLTQRKAGLPSLTVYRLTGNPARDFARDFPRDILFPEPTYSAAAHQNREFNTSTFRYSYQSMVSPPSVYEYTVATRQSRLLKQQQVPGGFKAADYGSERIWVEAPASNGHPSTMIPVSLVYRRDRFFNRRATDTDVPWNPLYVYGYGSYGIDIPATFSPTRLALLDRGVLFAIAHVRGGGELGDPWHDAGKMRSKINTFTDFIACVEALLREGYGDPAKVAIEGGSAGGLLMGAVVNMRPDLFRAVISHVPFVDVMNTMLDASLPLTVGEYEEWGNPNDPADFAYMHSYSPYENLDKLDPQKVPAMLVKTSLNDSQVMYWEPAKYVAKLRALKRNQTPLLLHINMEAGHGGASGRYDYLKEIAFDYAFLLTQLDLV